MLGYTPVRRCANRVGLSTGSRLPHVHASLGATLAFCLAAAGKNDIEEGPLLADCRPMRSAPNFPVTGRSRVTARVQAQSACYLSRSYLKYADGIMKHDTQ